MATSRNEFFRDTIKSALDGLTAWDSNISIDYSYQNTRFPFCYFYVGNENRIEEWVNEDDYPGIERFNVGLWLRLGYLTQRASDSNLTLLEAGDTWIEAIDEVIHGIALPKEYTQTGKYKIGIIKIEINNNTRYRLDEAMTKHEIYFTGRLIYDKNYL